MSKHRARDQEEARPPAQPRSRSATRASGAEEKPEEPKGPVPALPKALLPVTIGGVVGLLSYAARSAGGGIGLLFLGFMLLRPLAMQMKVGYQGGREWAGAMWFVFNLWFVVWGGLRALLG